MQLSNEQSNKFYDIVQNLLKMQKRAEDMVGRMQRSNMPDAAEAYRLITDSFDSLVKFVYEELDFQKGIDGSQLEMFNKLYSNTIDDLSQIKSKWNEYTHDDYIWDPMHRLDVDITDFLKETREIRENPTPQVMEQQTPAPNIEQTITKEPQKAETKEQPKNLNEQPQTNQDIKSIKQLGVGTVFALKDVLGKMNDRDPNSFDNVWAGLREASDKGLLSEEMKQEYRDIVSWAKERHVSKMDATQRLKKILLDQLDGLDKTSLVQSQYKSIDAINKVKDFVSTYNEFNANGDFGEAQYELEKLARYIGNSVKQGLISNGVANDYRRTIRQTYGKNNEQIQKQAADELIKISDMHKNRIAYGQQPVIKESHKEKENKQTQTNQVQTADQRTPTINVKQSKVNLAAKFKQGQENVLNLMNEQNQNEQNKNEHVKQNNLNYMIIQQRRLLGG